MSIKYKKNENFFLSVRQCKEMHQVMNKNVCVKYDNTKLEKVVCGRLDAAAH